MKKDGNFLDSKSLIAIGITVVFFIGWQNYLAHKYPNRNQQVAQNQNLPSAVDSKPAGSEATKAAVEAPKTPSTSQLSEKTLVYEDEHIQFKISSLGMGIQDVLLKDYQDREGQKIVLSQAHENVRPFQTSFLGKPEAISFELSQKSANEFVGTANIDGALVQKTMRVRSQDYAIETTVSLSGKLGPQAAGLRTTIVEQIKPKQSSGFLSPSFDHQTLYVSHSGSKDHKVLDPEKIFTDKFSGVAAVTMGSLYFLEGLVDRSPVIPDLVPQFDGATRLYFSNLDYPVVAGSDHLDLKYETFVGPKSFEILNRIDPQLAGAIDYGYFGVIAEPLLRLMKWFFAIFGNYGLAIIFLTLTVRLLVMPFNIMSYRSMKAMQGIQPKLQAVRERFKEDPQTMNREVMAMMKENKVNPLGGCLPMLLQLPVFFALYRVFGNSIELYQAPFMLWIHDLSLKDPFYVLPVLMGITMFIQQRMTPSTMDPAQAKVMMFMPIMFTFFMISLPSGLTLYIFVSTLFAIIQQRIFMRDSSPSAQKTVQVQA